MRFITLRKHKRKREIEHRFALFAPCFWTFLSLSNGCGTIAGNPTKPGAGGGATSKFISDSTLGSSLVSSHVDDAIDAVGEDALSASSVSFALVDQSSNLDVAPKIQLSAQSEYIRSCEVVGATVVSSRSFNGERSDTFTRFGRQFTKSLSGTDSTKVTWSKAGSNLKCSGADSKVAGIDFLQSKDLTQESTIDRSWVATLTNNTSNTVVQKRQHNLSGTRKSTWAASAFAGGLTTVQRSSIWEVSKEDVLVSRSGESTTTKTTLKVDAAIPMITEITWNSGGPSSWKERTINQGSIINDQDDNSRITLAFDQLKFQKATGCTPVSGHIKGKVYNQAVDADPALTFVIKFESGVGSIVWSSGETMAYSPSNCSLDD